MSAKHRLYEVFLERSKAALSDGNHLESAWYSYAVLEDRCRSLLRNSGGEGEKKGVGKPIQTLGLKLKELSKRSKKDALLDSCFEYARLNAWKTDRNNLTHAMADGSMSLTDIDLLAEKLATDGLELSNLYAAAARRLKKNRDQVAVPVL